MNKLSLYFFLTLSFVGASQLHAAEKVPHKEKTEQKIADVVLPISDEQIKNLLLPDIDHIPVDQKKIQREFEAFKKYLGLPDSGNDNDESDTDDELANGRSDEYTTDAGDSESDTDEEKVNERFRLDLDNDVMDDWDDEIDTDDEERLDKDVTNALFKQAVKDEGIQFPKVLEKAYKDLIFRGGVIPLPRSKTPLLHQIVDRLSVKLGIATPLIFTGGSLTEETRFHDGVGISLLPPFIIIGCPVLEELDDQSLEVMLAGACGHIKGMHTCFKGIMLKRPLSVMQHLFSPYDLKKIMTYDWKKLFYKGGIYGYLVRTCERAADKIAIDIVGPERFIKSVICVESCCQKPSKKKVKQAIYEGFAQGEENDTLMKSIRMANNEELSWYDRVVFAARIWAKNLADAKAHTKAD
jgi:hypothetical protein